ncbi:hypothetical protein FDQ92_10010 [Desulfoglaeba alkanexedens ALDC]|jgi:Fe-S cluster assembly iron-binding protein IscA|uniref:Heme biosynthesis protein HemY n=2 Tax=Desulfoglaeba alkanexedens TaxID=361111 RepID=A0A4P8L3D7_9BACT|nr:hypothetical protein FDQ92_10010 [Desulfoglaeba alkanexedens ALDC]
MVLDEPNDNDEVFEVNGFTMIVEKALMDLTQALTVDYVDYGMMSGFRIDCQVPIGTGGGCGTSCSCC